MKETEEALEDLQNKYSALDKTKTRIAAELEDLNLDIEKVLANTECYQRGEGRKGAKLLLLL